MKKTFYSFMLVITMMFSSESEAGFYISGIHVYSSTDFETFFQIRYSYSYDSNGNLISELSERLTDSNWVNEKLSLYTYDDAGNKTRFLRKEWDSTKWVDEYRIDYNYDLNNRMLSLETFKWINDIRAYISRAEYTYDNAGNKLADLFLAWQVDKWDSVSRYSYTYDDAGHILTNTNEQYDDSLWVNWNIRSYSYSPNGNILTFYYGVWKEEEWKYTAREIYTWDESGNKLSSVGSESDSTDGWIVINRFTYTYDNYGNMLSLWYEEFNNGEWIDRQKYTYNYDGSGKIQNELRTADGKNREKFSYFYDESDNPETFLWELFRDESWVNYRRRAYTYSTAGNITSVCYDKWVNGQWGPGDKEIEIRDADSNLIKETFGYKIELTWINITGVDENAKDMNLSGFFPNPFSNSTTLNYYLDRPADVDIDIYDISGRLVKHIVNEYQSPGNHRVEFDAEGLPAGAYFCRVVSGREVETHTVCIQR